MYRVVIDANVWIKLARAKNIAPLIDRFTAYNLVALTNNYLLSEVFEAVVENAWLSENSTHRLIDFIRRNSRRVIETAV